MQPRETCASKTLYCRCTSLQLRPCCSSCGRYRSQAVFVHSNTPSSHRWDSFPPCKLSENILEVTAEKTYQTSKKNWVSLGCLTASDLQCKQNIVWMGYHGGFNGVRFSPWQVKESVPCDERSSFDSLQKWPYFDFTFISASFAGDKAAHCWDTCVIMSVPGASCPLTHVVLSTPLPFCVIQSVPWGEPPAWPS